MSDYLTDGDIYISIGRIFVSRWNRKFGQILVYKYGPSAPESRITSGKAHTISMFYTRGYPWCSAAIEFPKALVSENDLRNAAEIVDVLKDVSGLKNCFDQKHVLGETEKPPTWGGEVQIATQLGDFPCRWEGINWK